jgi:hypothetical protein
MLDPSLNEGVEPNEASQPKEQLLDPLSKLRCLLYELESINENRLEVEYQDSQTL